MTKKDLSARFSKYPDLVTVDVFCKMLGGIGDKTARNLLREGHVEHFMIRHTYHIPKSAIIDYLCSEHYADYKNKLKHKIRVSSTKK